MKHHILLLVIFFSYGVFAQKNASVSFEKWISLKGVGSPLISPDGRTIVYSSSSTDWSNNSYDNELWMSRDAETPIQLTRTNKNSSFAARFTPDSKYISFLADRGDKSQLYIIAVQGGEAMQVTKDEDGINSYEWSPDGSKIVYQKAEQEGTLQAAEEAVEENVAWGQGSGRRQLVQQVEEEEGFDPEAVLSTIAREKINFTLFVPTMIYVLLDHPSLPKTDLSSLELILYGASPMAPSRLVEGIERIGPVFSQLYGQTECYPVSVLRKTDHDPKRPELFLSCGFPIAGCQAKILNEDDQEVPIG